MLGGSRRHPDAGCVTVVDDNRGCVVAGMCSRGFAVGGRGRLRACGVWVVAG